MFNKLYEFDKSATLDVYNNQRKRYKTSTKKLDKGFNAYKVYWEHGPNEQKTRFKNLLEIGVKNNDSILDFGCGFGDLYSYTKDIGLNVNYIGVDINRNFIRDAIGQFGTRMKHLLGFKLNPKFYTINTIEDVKEKTDWFIASGTFTYSFEIEDIINILIKAFNKCNKGMAFNILPTRCEDKVFKMRLGKAHCNSYNPDYLLRELSKHFENVTYNQKMISYEDKDGVFYIMK